MKQYEAAVEFNGNENFERSVNSLACCSKSGVESQNQSQFKNYEFQYNKAIYFYNKLDFAASVKACEKAVEFFDGEETEKDRQQIQFVKIVAGAYASGVMPAVAEFKFDHLNQLFQMFQIVFQIEFSTPTIENLQLIKSKLRGNIELVDSITNNCDQTVHHQINLVKKFISTVSSNKPTNQQISGPTFVQLSQAFSNIVSSHFPTNSTMKKEKKEPGCHFQKEWAELIQTKNYVPVDKTFSRSQSLYLISLLKSFGFQADSSRFSADKYGCLGGQVAFTDVSGTQTIENLTAKNAEILTFGNVFKVKNDKEMPLKWQKKVKKVLHQGAKVNDRVEVTKVAKVPVRRGKGPRK